DKGKIVAGLCQMMADKITELLAGVNAGKIMITGGCSQNRVFTDFLQSRFAEIIIPDQGRCFESFGTAIWAAENNARVEKSGSEIFRRNRSSFDFIAPLKEFEERVSFHSIQRQQPETGDRCLLGIDVGSTTTKAVLVRDEDQTVLASVYLRTGGDPVRAARNCYRDIAGQLDVEVEIVGLGVTGSGRQLVGLHALTDSIINEIIAHATAAVYFDEKVDTIFEIGGQDAKYTHLTAGVPTDYAMNEACSAGTGSFLEESASESLNVAMEDIADLALKGSNPPNFNDQCAAFISSDIKNAIQEGISTEDICAGLVYSICLNYSNRVQGNRPTGEKVFMQGGVCYNRAVPVAMAALTGSNIVVPPEPGLMGAFGVALVVRKHLQLGLVEESSFDLKELAAREIVRHKPFICQGSAENCDRKCEIAVMEIEGKKYPFGGICSKYDNVRSDKNYDIESLDQVRRREKLAFDDYAGKSVGPSGSVGMNRSLMTNTLFPLFSTFFAELGFEPLLPDKIRESGRRKQGAAFCYPVEISHGYIEDLIEKKPDFLFIPHVKALPTQEPDLPGTICPLAQGESYYLRASWEEIDSRRHLEAVFDFTGGYSTQEKQFSKIGRRLGCSKKEINNAFTSAVCRQNSFEENFKKEGQRLLGELESAPERRAFVLFGRPYNAFSSDANMGIPRKLASRGELIIPLDMLPLESERLEEQMYWSMGQKILKGAAFVNRHPQLFGVYITNFSCGPDSFLISYFRQKMGKKPSLTLELDSHTADAGLDTRVEAFLDIVDSYQQLSVEEKEKKVSLLRAARIVNNGSSPKVIDSQGKKLSFSDGRVTVLVPSMGDNASRGIAAAMRYAGINARACPPPANRELELGRANTLCKECLPLQLTVGTLFNYLEDRDPQEVVVYFMPDASGPCRFGQYNIFMKKMILEKEIENVAFFSPTAENSYSGMGMKFTRRAWDAIVIGDLLDEIYNSLLVLAADKKKALKTYEKCRQRIFQRISEARWSRLEDVLGWAAGQIGEIELVDSYRRVPKVILTGEIYVRSDAFSRQYLVERLARRGIITRVAPNIEWIYYTDYCVREDLSWDVNVWDKLTNRLSGVFKKNREKAIKDILGQTNLCSSEPLEVEDYINAAADVVSPELTGEAILTVGGAISELIGHVSGVIAVGPFGCMPNRVAEAVLNGGLDSEKRSQALPGSLEEKVMEEFPSLPFLAIETDGSAFPQVIEARLEAFCLQVERLHEFIKS
ncbi:MAG: acyl-CoA dehydratase activase, partial [bacterium]